MLTRLDVPCGRRQSEVELECSSGSPTAMRSKAQRVDGHFADSDVQVYLLRQVARARWVTYLMRGAKSFNNSRIRQHFAEQA